MLRHIAVATVLTCGALGAYAQTSPAQTSPQSPPSAPSASMGTTSAVPDAADAKNLIGRNIQNVQNETIGEIKSVFIGADGRVDSVMVGVGGFLGIGDREVRLAWADLQIADGGRKVTVDMTKEQLEALPEYTYADRSWRGQVFGESGPYAPPGAAPADRRAADSALPADRAERRAEGERAVAPTAPADRNATPAERTVSTGDFNAQGDMSTSALIGTKVRNQNGETVGSVEDIYLDKGGAIKTVVVSVGGFLGIGSKAVAVQWSDFDFDRDGNSIVVKTSWTRDSLMAMPDYKNERQIAAEPAPAPPAGTPAQQR